MGGAASWCLVSTILTRRRELHLKLLAYHYTTQQGLTVTADRNTRHTGAPVLRETMSTNQIHERCVLVMAAQTPGQSNQETGEL